MSDYMGESLAIGDVHGDEYSDLIVGVPSEAEVHIFAGATAVSASSSARASTVITGPPGSGFGTALVVADLDGDGFGGGNDCDDNDASIYLGAAEISDDGIDQDCNGFDLLTCYVDADGDGRLDVYIGYLGEGRPTLDGWNAPPNQLYLQRAGGRFEEAAARLGVADTGWTIAACAVDL
ncbi:MAG: MopE-related protein, partial [Planctomycetota bacterium]|nr:MopE-related protein [Planctomycetota bacterium]